MKAFVKFLILNVGNLKNIYTAFSGPFFPQFHFFILCSGIQHQNKLSCDWDVSIPVHLKLLRLSVQLWVMTPIEIL